MKIWNSLRFKIIGMLIIIIIPLMLFLYYTNVYSMNVVRNQVSKSYNDLLSLHMSQLQQMMEEERVNLWKIIYDDENVNTLLLYSFDSSEYKIAESAIKSTFTRTFAFHNTLDTIFLYIVRDDHLIMATKGDTRDNGFAVKYEFVKKNINAMIDFAQQQKYKDWQYVEAGDHKGLVKVVNNSEGIYIGAWVDAVSFIKPLELLDMGEGGDMLAMSLDGTPVSPTRLSAGLLKDVHGSLGSMEKNYTTIQDHDSGEKFLLVAKRMSFADLDFITVIPEEKLLMALPSFQKTIAFIPYLILLVLVVYLVSLQGILFVPMKDLIKAMKEAAKGSLGTKLRERGSNEFIFLMRTFNDMLSQIRNLKIDVYEEKLKTQKAELKHLQVQIHPHFYANSLNTIYNLAYAKDFKSVQKMSQYLAEYFRFVIRTGRELVTLQDEIRHIRNYLEIQKYRFTDNLTFHISVPEEYHACMLPPLTIQTFVENSIIYGYNERNDPLEINITVCADSGNPGEFYEVIISDDGKGFHQEVLAKLQSAEYTNSKVDEHIGIWNVYRRLKMHFEDSASITFANGTDKGAVVRVRLRNNAVNNREEHENVQLTGS